MFTLTSQMIVKAFSDIQLYGIVIPNIFSAYPKCASAAKTPPFSAFFLVSHVF